MENSSPNLGLSREIIYRLFSACYYQPEEALIEEDVFGQLEAALDLHSDAWAELAKQLRIAFLDTGTEALLLDYTRLFLGPNVILAKPYGSVYLDDEALVMGDSTIKALACYSSAGFSVAEDFREMPDHVAVELEFLYLLTFKENQALADNNPIAARQFAELKGRFLVEHLGAWIEPFGERIRQGSQTDFYRLLAQLTTEFVLDQTRKCLN